jgi:hypothetical protein
MSDKEPLLKGASKLFSDENDNEDSNGNNKRLSANT